MAQYFTEFDEYTGGAQPSDWTKAWNTTETWLITASGVGGEASLRPNGGSVPSCCTWDDIGSPTGDVEIVAKIDLTTTASETGCVGFRLSGGSGTEYGYYVTLVHFYERIYLKKYDNGTPSTLASADNCFVDTAVNFMWVRAQLLVDTPTTGDVTFRARWWQDGDAEPSGWCVSVVDSSPLSVGPIGLQEVNVSTETHTYIFGVGTDGDEAPSTDPNVPDQPELISPYDDQIVSAILSIVYGEVVDPQGVGVVYHSRYKAAAATTWTDIFTDREGSDDYNFDISGLSDGIYDFELWAETDGGYESTKNQIQFVIHNGIPSEPNITAPYEGQKWQQTTNDVEWDAAVDPEDDSLDYDARYKLVGATSWTSLFTGETGLSYSWNQTGLAVGDYELEVWANDGVGDGPADHVYFSIFIADQPAAPRIRILEIGEDFVTAGLEEYVHPSSRAWQATKWELIPFGGDWSNPVVSYTTTDSAEQLEYTFTGLPPGFMGVVRASFQDDVNTWGDPSTEALFVIPDQTNEFVRRWERNAGWGVGAHGTRGSKGVWDDPPPYIAQPVSAIVDPDSEYVGSFIISGYMMAGGCYCGWIGTDTALVGAGLGVFLGDSENGGEYGVIFGIDYGVKNVFSSGLTGSHGGKPYLYAQFENCSIHASKTLYGAQFDAYSQVTEGVTPKYGQPIGPWTSEFTHWPAYFVELWVQRNIAAATTRVRGRVKYVGWATDSLDESLLDRKGFGQDDWDIDYTFPCLTACGQPGFWRRQWSYAFDSSFVDFWGLAWTALRDEGLQEVTNLEPLAPYSEEEPETCTPVTEVALAAPVFFPAPPNGDVEEDWVHPSDLITARDDTEQRISLREIPVEMVSFTTTLLTSREVTNLMALIWEEQPSRWGVPLWMDAATLDTTLAASSGTIPAGYFDPDGRRFDEMNYVALWQDQFTWDFLPASLNPDGSVTLTGTTSQEFVANKTRVIPCRIGRMMRAADFDRDAPEIGDLNVTFVLEAVNG